MERECRSRRRREDAYYGYVPEQYSCESVFPVSIGRRKEFVSIFSALGVCFRFSRLLELFGVRESVRPRTETRGSIMTRYDSDFHVKRALNCSSLWKQDSPKTHYTLQFTACQIILMAGGGCRGTGTRILGRKCQKSRTGEPSDRKVPSPRGRSPNWGIAFLIPLSAATLTMAYMYLASFASFVTSYIAALFGFICDIHLPPPQPTKIFNKY